MGLAAEEQPGARVALAVQEALRLHAVGGSWLEALAQASVDVPPVVSPIAARLSRRAQAALVVGLWLGLLLLGILGNAVDPGPLFTFHT